MSVIINWWMTNHFYSISNNNRPFFSFSNSIKDCAWITPKITTEILRKLFPSKCEKPYCNFCSNSMRVLDIFLLCETLVFAWSNLIVTLFFDSIHKSIAITYPRWLASENMCELEFWLSSSSHLGILTVCNKESCSNHSINSFSISSSTGLS